jgi:hypothetical protein
MRNVKTLKAMSDIDEFYRGLKRAVRTKYGHRKFITHDDRLILYANIKSGHADLMQWLDSNSYRIGKRVYRLGPFIMRVSLSNFKIYGRRATDKKFYRPVKL